MKKRFVLMFFFMLAVGSGRLWAAGVPCDQASVQTAINNAASGDTITLNAGTCEWASPVLVPNKSLTLQGAGCVLDVNGDPVSCNTVILDAVASGVLLQFNCETGKAHRLTGIAFKAAVNSSGSPKRTTKEQDGVLSLSCTNLKDGSGNQTTLRIDHTLVDTLYGDYYSIGSAVGVMDHNSLLVSSSTIGSVGLGTIFPIIGRGATWNDPAGLHGDRSWTSADLLYPYDPGADKSQILYIEDNKIVGNGGFCGDGFSGARLAYRFNHIFGCTIEVHGTDTSGRDRGTRYLEVYKNTADYGGLSGYLKGYFANTRSGSAIFWGNTSINLPNGVDYSTLTFDDYRTYFSARSFGASGGFSLLDINDPSNPYDPGTACRSSSSNGTSRACTVASVINTAGAGTTISVTGSPGWADNQWVNFSIVKESCVAGGGPQCVSIVSGNTSGNQITFLNCLGLCQQNLAFSPGDQFEINKIVTTLDQPGRGGGSLLSCTPVIGTTPENCTSYIGGGQLDYPIYEWLNCGSAAPTCTNNYLHNGPRSEAKPTVIPNKQYFNFSTSFNGTLACSTAPDCGVGVGTKGQMSAMPCVIGMLYWVTDEAEWNPLSAGTDGQAYKCTSTNVWTLFYTPYTYPHPLVTGAGGVGTGGGGGGLTVSSIALTVSVGTVTQGIPQTFTATVTDGAGKVTGGTVTFTDNTTGATIASNVALNNSGQATTAPTLALGSHSVQATYNPDSNHGGSVSNSVAVIVNSSSGLIATSTDLSSPTVTATAGTPVALTATVTAGSTAVIGGTVTFTDTTTGAILATNVALSASGQASTSPTLTSGIHVIQATYNPDATHAGSNSSTLSITVTGTGGIATSTVLTSSIGTVTVGSPLTLTATVTVTAGSAAVTGGTVTFTDTLTGNVLASNVPLSSTGQATIAPILAAGTFLIQATYNPDTDHTTSSSNSVALAVNAPGATATSTALATSAVTVTSGATVALTASVTSGSTAVTAGTVTFTDTTTGGTLADNVPLNASGQASASPILPAGIHVIQATYVPDSSHGGSVSTTVLITVNTAGGPAATMTALMAPATTVTVGTPVTLTTTVTADGVAVTGGTVTFTDTTSGAALASNLALNGSGQATTSLSLLAGIHAIKVTYSPDALHSGSTSNTIAILVNAASGLIETSTVLVSSAATGVLGAPITLIANVTANGAAVTGGTVTFTDTVTGAVIANSVILNASGQALTLSTMALGTHIIQVTYNPDATHSGSTSNTITVNVTATADKSSPASPPSVAMTAPLANSTVSGFITISADATDTTGVASVQFQLDGGNLDGVLLIPPYSLSFSTYSLTNGNHTVTVTALNYTNLTKTDSVTFNVNNPSPTATYSIGSNGAAILSTTDDAGSDLEISHVLVQPTGASVAAQVAESSKSLALTSVGGPAPAGVAIFGLHSNNVLVSEASVTAAPMVSSGRIYAEIHGGVTTGIALSNLNSQDASIAFTFTDGDGNDVKSGSFVLGANHQIAVFLNQAPLNGPADIQGSFSFTSSVPVAAIALRGLTNERSEFLVTTLPVVTPDAPSGSLVLPHFADGGGWTTQVFLVNPTNALQTGTVQFYGQGSASQSQPLLNMIVNSAAGNTFSYSLAPHAVARFVTANAYPATQVGSIRVAPVVGGSSSLPSAVAIFSYVSNGITVGTASVSPVNPGLAFQTYMESSGVSGDAGSIQSGVAVANPSADAVFVTVNLTNLDGTPSGLPAAMVYVSPGGQTSKFIDELFPKIPLAGFRGIARLTSPTPVVVTALRTRYNERRDFLITSTPPLDEAATQGSVILFPHMASGQGYGTQIVLFGKPGSGKVFVLGQDGTGRPTTSLKQ